MRSWTQGYLRHIHGACLCMYGTSSRIAGWKTPAVGVVTMVRVIPKNMLILVILLCYSNVMAL